jgi:hypothetical protein
MKTEMSSMLIDLIDIIHRNVESDITRQDVYTEMLNLFDGDETVLAMGLSEDPIYDMVYKDTFNVEEDDT